jgi:hypothetical protein
MDRVQPTILSDGYMPQPPLSVGAYQEAIGHEVGRSDWIVVDR